MSIAIWCLLTKHCGPCHRLAIFSDACRSANYKQTRYTFSDKGTGVWHRAFPHISACSLHLGQAVVSFHYADAAAQKKGCQESDKDRVKFVTVVQMYCHLRGTPPTPRSLPQNVFLALEILKKSDNLYPINHRAGNPLHPPRPCQTIMQ